MPRTLYLNRDQYGDVTEATFDKPLLLRDRIDEWTGKVADAKHYKHKRRITSYKELVWAMCRRPCSWELFCSAWRRALRNDFMPARVKLSLLHEYLEEADNDAGVVEDFIGELVNDPRSQFYLHG